MSKQVKQALSYSEIQSTEFTNNQNVNADYINNHKLVINYSKYTNSETPTLQATEVRYYESDDFTKGFSLYFGYDKAYISVTECNKRITKVSLQGISEDNKETIISWCFKYLTSKQANIAFIEKVIKGINQHTTYFYNVITL